MARLRTAYYTDERGRVRRDPEHEDLDLGPAAAHSDGLAAIGRLSATRVQGTPDPLEQLEHAAGAGPIVTRRATAAELARLDGPPAAVAARPGPAMHVVRPNAARMATSRQRGADRHREVIAAQHAAPANPNTPWRSYRSALGTTARQEEPPVTDTAPPVGVQIPCGSCLHEPVCYLKRELPKDPNLLAEPMELGPGLRLVTTGVRVECDSFLGELPGPEPIRPIAMAVDHEPPHGPAPEPVAPAAASTSARFPLPRDRDERDRVVCAAIRATPTIEEAATRLGVSASRVGQITSEMRLLGRMPADVDELLRSRGRAGGRAGRGALLADTAQQQAVSA